MALSSSHSVLLAVALLPAGALGLVVGTPARFAGGRGACVASEGPSKLSEAEVAKIGNLVEDDEWLGLATELAVVVRCAVRESAKKNVADFTGKDSYKIGDISKEMDARIKSTVADLRSKDEYELGDATLAMQALAKEEVCKLSGKDEYEFGDLSKEVDARIKATVAEYCGKEAYEPGDLTREVSSRVNSGVAGFTGKTTYEFGDVSRELEKRRAAWVTEMIGKQDYEFGDLVRGALRRATTRLAPRWPRGPDRVSRRPAPADEEGGLLLHREGRVRVRRYHQEGRPDALWQQAEEGREVRKLSN